MNIYDAIMKAADHIERFPDQFAFTVPIVPQHPCGSPGCALGWIGFFAGVKTCDYSEVPKEILGYEDHYQFYLRLTEIEGAKIPKGEDLDWADGHWPGDANICARVLRLYAEKYHAPVAAPDWNAMATAEGYEELVS